ncbi:MAG: TRAP transporter large permease subunit [Planctomycetota bacterium]|nr:TRAP transporter large permease subunit [Planctomycetota bacterium]
MEWWHVLLLFLGGLIAVLATGFPVAFSFLLVNSIGLYALMGTPGLFNMSVSIFSSLCSFTLIPVPLFILMGELMFHSGIADNAIKVIDMWLGRLPGRLSLVASLCGVIFAATSGSTMANTAMLGSILVPEMRKRGYSIAMSVGPILGVGGLAMLIPPSAMAVIMATVAQLSVSKILVAGVIPGLAIGVIICAYIILTAVFNPAAAPRFAAERIPLARKLAFAVRHLIPIAFIIFMVIGLILLGVATASEAAASGTVAAFLVALLERKASFQVVKRSLMGTTSVTVMVFMIIAAAKSFSSILAFTGATNGLFSFVERLNMAPMMVIVFMQIIVLFMGTFMESMSIILISIPVFLPIAARLGFDPIWFATLMLLNIEVGQITPPFGMLLFVMKGVTPPDVGLHEVILSAVPYIFITLAAMGLTMAFPAMALWLPSLV